MRRRLHEAAVLLILPLVTQPVAAAALHAQREIWDDTTRFWVGAGLGVTSLGSLAFSANAGVHDDPIVAGVRVSANSE